MPVFRPLCFVVGCVFAAASAGAVLAKDDETVEVDEVGIVCLNPGDLSEAFQSGGDRKWLKNLGCTWLPQGMKVRQLEPPLNRITGDWKVRVSMPDGEGLTAWAKSCSFRLPGSDKAFPC